MQTAGFLSGSLTVRRGAVGIIRFRTGRWCASMIMAAAVHILCSVIKITARRKGFPVCSCARNCWIWTATSPVLICGKSVFGNEEFLSGEKKQTRPVRLCAGGTEAGVR